MRNLLYKAAFFVAFFCYFPILLCKAFFRESGVREVFKHLFPEKLPLLQKPLLWAHAVSVGEVVALAPVLEAYLKRHPEYHVILSTVTQTGFRTAQKLIPEAHVVAFPFDFAFSIRKILGENAPSLVLLSEGDAWPSFLREMKRRGASLVLINGKMSDTSFRRYQKVQGWAKWLYAPIDVFCVQNVIMKERFIALGVNPEKIFVTGNTKTDQATACLSKEELKNLRNSLRLSEEDKVVVLGSTHYPEETQLIESLLPLIRKGVKIIVVPRHPERASQVLFELQKCHPELEIFLSTTSPEKWNILVVDKLGILTSMYQIASLAAVCGSFVESIGGHNIFESCVYGVPTIVGPYMHSQKALFESALSAGAVLQVDRKHFCEAVQNLFIHEEARQDLMRKAFLWAEAQKGASEKTVDVMLDKITGCSLL